MSVTGSCTEYFSPRSSRPPWSGWAWPRPGGAALILYPLMAFATGYVALWLYAVARAGLGARPRTAVKTALAVWMLLYVIPSVDLVMEGIWSRQAFWTAAAMGLVTLAAATLAGARVYRPKAEAPTRSDPITAG